ncbi:hypothetical protein A2617_03505 [Candidatus Daviesbacteria bacterium RIFOXYD1_FULL_41_10]|uniref:Uncharacterized protein n=1 Tax=Candidatus Daviesbacteria bacterium RIFOXYD1_FULL_41_10 TaxID=1797801 RepID=A0A1F5N0R1_9BACT|nr:MAG: hypothetical protein A2617_03505 [Candidatus Daviesbacteria bacterium RIFOXYD1_FULL_41_10]
MNNAEMLKRIGETDLTKTDIKNLTPGTDGLCGICLNGSALWTGEGPRGSICCLVDPGTVKDHLPDLLLVRVETFKYTSLKDAVEGNHHQCKSVPLCRYYEPDEQAIVARERAARYS